MVDLRDLVEARYSEGRTVIWSGGLSQRTVGEMGNVCAAFIYCARRPTSMGRSTRDLISNLDLSGRKKECTPPKAERKGCFINRKFSLVGSRPAQICPRDPYRRKRWTERLTSPSQVLIASSPSSALIVSKARTRWCWHRSYAVLGGSWTISVSSSDASRPRQTPLTSMDACSQHRLSPFGSLPALVRAFLEYLGRFFY